MTDGRDISEENRRPALRKPGGAGDAPRAGGKPEQPARYNLRSGRNIVPREGVAGHSLAIVIAIMTFLACLTLGAVASVSDTAATWQQDISREVTIQIKPYDNVEMEKALEDARALVTGFEGIAGAQVLDKYDTASLLEPWLGSGVNIDELPVPRLLTVRIEEGARPDFGAIRTALAEKVPGATLDDHRAWVDRLVTMAWTTMAIGLSVLALVLVATVLTVVFATRGAMAGNREIVEVLHFVGADSNFIAREFQRHFLVLAFRGALAGGAGAAAVFIGLAIWAHVSRTTPQGDQIAALFGGFSIGWLGYAGIAAIIGLIALLAAATSRFTVLRHVGGLETYGRRPE
jgi:cell division transport system permease protein